MLQAAAAAAEWGVEVVDVIDAADIASGQCEPWFAVALAGETWTVQAEYDTDSLIVRDFDGNVSFTLPANRPQHAAITSLLCWLDVMRWTANTPADPDFGGLPEDLPLTMPGAFQ